MLAKANAVIIIAHFWVTDLHRSHRTEVINFGMSSYILLNDYTNYFHLEDNKMDRKSHKNRDLGHLDTRGHILDNSLKEKVKKCLNINCKKFVRMS